MEEKNTEQLDEIEEELKRAAHQEELQVALAKVAITVSAVAERPEYLEQLEAGGDATDFFVACTLVYEQTLARVKKTHPEVASLVAATAVCVLERARRQQQEQHELEELISGGAHLIPMKINRE